MAGTPHEAADTLGRRWIAKDTLPADRAEALRNHLVTLDGLYRRHIAVEDHELFPAAARVLSAPDLVTIGREMAARRNVAFAPPATLAECNNVRPASRPGRARVFGRGQGRGLRDIGAGQPRRVLQEQPGV